tara:strand:- start:3056 stop:4444 length:1389 start_codon:yes stop_codon:yes gene_type:complete
LVVLDLLAAWEGDPSRYVGYSRKADYFRKGGGYWNQMDNQPILSERVFLRVIDFLTQSGLIANYVAAAGYSPMSSRMRASKELIDDLRGAGVNWTGVGFDPEAPVIFVKDKDKKLAPFPDNEEFDFERAEVNLRRINANLQTTYINLDISDADLEELGLRMRGDEEEMEGDSGEYREPFELSNRSIRRIFSLGTFNAGGRFYGGWWQGIPGDYRKHIIIDGAVTREMDFSSMQPRLMYAEVGAAAPEDAYDVPGWPSEVRPHAKKAFNQLINSDTSSRNENQWHRFNPDMELPSVPEDWSTLTKHERSRLRSARFMDVFKRPYQDLLSDLVEMHREIDSFFFSGAWGRMQRLDSDIAERVMIKLLDRDVPVTALPIHDSFIVRRGAEADLLNAMHEAHMELVQAPCSITIEDAVFDTPDEEDERGIVRVSDILDETTKAIAGRRQFYQRATEWQRAFGPVDV